MRNLPRAIAAIALTLTPAALAANYPVPGAPLKQPAFVALPLGSVHAQGWLLTQLELQRDGLTGHAEEVLDELGPSSAWRGGDKDNWERSPYYVKGLIPLAFTLDDPTLKARAKVWVDWALQSRRSDGSYGPASNNDWWPRMVSNYFLRDYEEATGDGRILTLLTNYYHYMLAELPKRPLKDWGKSRAGDDMDTVVWLYARTEDPALLKLLDLLRAQAYDWPAIMRENTFQSFGRDFQPKHNVNVPQAAKMPAVAWLRSGSDADRAAPEQGYQNLMRENGLAFGIESGTEVLAGRSPSQGVEFCSIVEQMLSDETLVRILGEARYADRLETLAFNALPAAWSRDLKALRYYTLPNHVQSVRGNHGWGQNYDNGHVYGPRSGFPCCCFNVHQGWPKFVQNSWAATPDNGLAVIAYAPTTVTVKVASGATAHIIQDTSYPFGEEIHFKITMTAPAQWPLLLRIPAWCDAATLMVNGQPVAAAKPGEFTRVDRLWSTGDEVQLKLPMHEQTLTGVHGTVTLQRGPLVYSLALDHETKVVGNVHGFSEFEETAKTPWNYALDTKVPPELLQDDKPGGNPFVSPPVKLKVKARRLPDWTLAWNGTDAMDPPTSPAGAGGLEEELVLAPFGSAELRVTSFPVLGSAALASSGAAFNFNDNTTAGWSWLGGGWWAHDGKLRSSGMNGGTRDFRAMVETGDYADLKLQATVTPPEKGDAGVVFRVTKDAVGDNAYQGYYAGVDGRQLLLGKADGHSWTALKSAPFTHSAGKPAKLTVMATGPHLQVTVEGGPTVFVDDTQWTHGRVGVRLFGQDPDHPVALFDDVILEPVRGEPARAEPAK